MEDRHQGYLIGIVDAAVEGVVGVPDVAIFDAGIFGVIFLDEFDHDRLDDGVEIGAAGGVDEIAVGGEDGDHGIAGDAEIAARGTDEDFHGFIENVVGDLNADFVVALGDFRGAFFFVGCGWGGLQPFQFFFQRWDRHGSPSCFASLTLFQNS